MQQMARRIGMILLCAGLIAGGLAVLAATPAAEMLATTSGDQRHGPPPEAGAADEAGGAGGEQRPAQRREHAEHNEEGALLNALPGIGTHLALIGLVTAGVVLFSKGRAAWRAGRHRPAPGSGIGRQTQWKSDGSQEVALCNRWLDGLVLSCSVPG